MTTDCTMPGLRPRRHTPKPQRQPTTDELYGPQANVISLAKWRETKALMVRKEDNDLPGSA